MLLSAVDVLSSLHHFFNRVVILLTCWYWNYSEFSFELWCRLKYSGGKKSEIRWRDNCELSLSKSSASDSGHIPFCMCEVWGYTVWNCAYIMCVSNLFFSVCMKNHTRDSCYSQTLNGFTYKRISFPYRCSFSLRLFFLPQIIPLQSLFLYLSFLSCPSLFISSSFPSLR